MGSLTKEELLMAIKAINDLNTYVIYDADLENAVKLDKITELIKFKLRLEKLYESLNYNKFG